MRLYFGMIFFIVMAILAFMGPINADLKSETKSPAKITATVKKKPVKLVDIWGIKPLPNSIDESPIYIQINFNEKVNQKFKFEVTPNIENRLLVSDKIAVIVFDDYYKFKELTNYVCKLSSTKPFTYNGQEYTEFSWYFKTPELLTMQNLIFEEPPIMPSSIGQPIDVFLPCDESSNFKIPGREDKSDPYIITLIGVFNAGVNGPPFSYQRQEYYKDIAQAKKEALAWIVSKGQNPKTMNIKWDYPKY